MDRAKHAPARMRAMRNVACRPLLTEELSINCRTRARGVAIAEKNDVGDRRASHFWTALECWSELARHAARAYVRVPMRRSIVARARRQPGDSLDPHRR